MAHLLRRLLRRPPRISAWPAGGRVMLVLVTLVIAGFGFAAVYGWPSQWPPVSVSDQWAAEGALFAGGAFLLAAIATLVAVLAYVNATLRPLLKFTDVAYPGRGEPLPLLITQVYPWGHCQAWSLTIRLLNTGAVAARYISVRVTFDNASLRPSQLTPLSPWKSVSPTLGNPQVVWWEGGADAIVHPGGKWVYELQMLGPMPLALHDASDEFAFDVEVVADEIATFSHRYRVAVSRQRGLDGVSEGERRRRSELLINLRQEYLLSHDGLSPGMLAGTEEVPTDWVNSRLAQMGENWSI